MALASGLFLSACSTFGIRTVEEPRFRVVANVGEVQVREYGPRLAAEVLVPGDAIAARSAGFRRIAAYIFGANKGRATIAMTAPVAQSGGAPSGAAGSIAMTAPVDQARDEGGQWRIRFFMPAHYTLESLPVPNDPGVHIATVPPQTVAVLRYSGIATVAAVKAADARLLRTLDASAWSPAGTPMVWLYDPPWALPPLRRNEAAVAVEPRAPG